MTREKEIQKMFEFIVENNSLVSNIRKSYDGWFIIDCPGVSVRKEKDIESLFIDFKEKKLKVYTALESGHNGDHYSCETEILSWEKLDSFYEFLRKEAIKIAIDKNKKVQEESRKQAELQAAEKTLDKFLRKL